MCTNLGALWEGTTEGCEYQKVGLIGEHLGGWLPHTLASVSLSMEWDLLTRWALKLMTSSFLSASQMSPLDLAFHSHVEMPTPLSLKPYGYTKLHPSTLLSFIDFLVTAPPPSLWLGTRLTVVLLTPSPAIITRYPYPHGWPICHHGLQFLNLLISSALPIHPDSDPTPHQHPGFVNTKTLQLCKQ